MAPSTNYIKLFVQSFYLLKRFQKLTLAVSADNARRSDFGGEDRHLQILTSNSKLDESSTSAAVARVVPAGVAFGVIPASPPDILTAKLMATVTEKAIPFHKWKKLIIVKQSSFLGISGHVGRLV